jgi:diaminopimelate decarboxylase
MIENAELQQIAEKYGTPCYVFDTEALQKWVGEIRKQGEEKYHLCFSVKANPFLIPTMEKLVDSLEVCSPGEFSICRYLHVDPDMILYSGVNKTEEDIHEAMQYGTSHFTAESLKHFREINAEAVKENKSVSVLLRINTGSQFGMSMNDLLEIVDHRNEYPHIHLSGIHYFAGTERRKAVKQLKELEKLKDLYHELEHEHAWRPEKLEYGPGLSVPMFTKDDFSDPLMPLRNIHKELCDFAENADVTIEMGRFFASFCGMYLTEVMDTKENGGVNYCIIDGGIHHVNYYGSMMGMNAPIIEHLSAADNHEKKEWCICGSLCSFNDVLVRSFPAEGLKEKDILVFKNIGAYSVTEGMYLFLSRKMPRILLRDKNGRIQEVRAYKESWKLNTMKEGE